MQVHAVAIAVIYDSIKEMGIEGTIKNIMRVTGAPEDEVTEFVEACISGFDSLDKCWTPTTSKKD